MAEKSGDKLFTCNPEKTSKTLLNSGIIIFPTDTVFGIGCLIGNTQGYNRIYQAKNRPIQKRMSLYVSSVEAISQWAQEPIYSNIINKYLPGAYTFIFKLNQRARKILPTNYFDNTIGIRIPDCPLLMELLEKIPDSTIAGTSANLSGCESILDPYKLDKRLLNKVDSVLFSETGKGIIKSQGESTVVDLVNKKILRQGKYNFDLNLIG